jgi:hypothetical protein
LYSSIPASETVPGFLPKDQFVKDLIEKENAYVDPNKVWIPGRRDFYQFDKDGNWLRHEGRVLSGCPCLTKETGWTLLKTGIMSFLAYQVSIYPFNPDNSAKLATIVKHAPCVKGVAWLAGCINLPISFGF